MEAFESEKGNVNIETSIGLGPVPIVVPRLMRAVPSNIARVIGDFEEISADETCETSENN